MEDLISLKTLATLGIVCLGILGDEILECSRWIALRIIRFAVRCLELEDRDRMEEELIAEMEHVPGRLTVLLWSTSILIGFARAKFIANIPAMMVRTFDVASALMGILLVWPFLTVICLMQKIAYPSLPVFTRTQMFGLDGSAFHELRFNAHDSSGKNTTPLGSFLIATELRSLPLYFNVLAGDLSMVGPRPCRAAVDNVHRINIKPGIFWTVKYKEIAPNYGNTIFATLRVYFGSIYTITRIVLLGHREK